MNVSSSAPSPCIVLLVRSLLCLPVLHEQRVAFLRELQCYFVFTVAIDSLIHEVVCRPPDVASPIVLILKCRVVPRDRWDNVLAPELLGVEQMLAHHAFRLFGCRDTRKHGIKVCRGKSLRKAPIPVPVFKDAILLVPEEFAHQAFDFVVLSNEVSVVILITEYSR